MTGTFNTCLRWSRLEIIPCSRRTGSFTRLWMKAGSQLWKRESRRFITTTEEVVPVALARKITADSVRHLSQNTQFITTNAAGEIRPTHILNVATEESYDLYENRFVYHLIQRLFAFVDKRTDVIFWSTGDETCNVMSMESKIDDAYEEISYKVEMTIKNRQSFVENDSDNMDVFKRIDRVRRMSRTLRTSSFCDLMNGCAKVRSPIQRTNLMMKDPDYRTCYKLWQFIESYDEVGYTIEEQDSALEFDEEYLLQMYTNLITNYTVFKSLLESDPRQMTEIETKHREPVKPKFIKKIEEQIVDDYNIPDVEVRKVIIEEVTQAQLDAEAKLAEETAKREELENSVSQLENSLSDLQWQLTSLSQQLEELEEQKSQIEAQKATLEIQLEDEQETLKAAQEAHEETKKALKEAEATSQKAEEARWQAEENSRRAEDVRIKAEEALEKAEKERTAAVTQADAALAERDQAVESEKAAKDTAAADVKEAREKAEADVNAAREKAAAEVAEAQENAAAQIKEAKDTAAAEVAAAREKADKEIILSRNKARKETEDARKQAAEKEKAAQQECKNKVDAAQKKAAKDVERIKKQSAQSVEELQKQLETLRKEKEKALAKAQANTLSHYIVNALQDRRERKNTNTKEDD